MFALVVDPRDASVGVRAILARFVVTEVVCKAAPARPQTVPGSPGWSLAELGSNQDRASSRIIAMILARTCP